MVSAWYRIANFSTDALHGLDLVVSIVLVGFRSIEPSCSRNKRPLVESGVGIDVGFSPVPTVAVGISQNHSRVRTYIRELAPVTSESVCAHERATATGKGAVVVAKLGMLWLLTRSTCVVLRRGAV